MCSRQGLFRTFKKIIVIPNFGLIRLHKKRPRNTVFYVYLKSVYLYYNSVVIKMDLKLDIISLSKHKKLHYYIFVLYHLMRLKIWDKLSVNFDLVWCALCRYSRRTGILLVLCIERCFGKRLKSIAFNFLF